VDTLGEYGAACKCEIGRRKVKKKKQQTFKTKAGAGEQRYKIVDRKGLDGTGIGVVLTLVHVTGSCEKKTGLFWKNWSRVLGGKGHFTRILGKISCFPETKFLIGL